MSFIYNGVTQIGAANLEQQLEANLVAFLDYANLSIGGFFNAYRNVSTAYSGYQSRLRLCDDTRFAKGRVWESARSNWVWEPSIQYGTQPIQISGVYINNTFYPPSALGYYINYPLGRVVFNNPLPTNSRVEVEYSYKYYNAYSAGLQWFRSLMNDSFRVDDYQFNQYGSGRWSLFSDSRAQFPAIFPYIVPRNRWEPKQLGGGSYCWQDVLFYVFAETTTDRDNIMDILSYQKEQKIFFFDKNKVLANKAYPLDMNGSLQTGVVMNYPQLVNSYLWSDAFIRNAVKEDKNDANAPHLFRGSVKWTLQINFDSI